MIKRIVILQDEQLVIARSAATSKGPPPPSLRRAWPSHGGRSRRAGDGRCRRRTRDAGNDGSRHAARHDASRMTLPTGAGTAVPADADAADDGEDGAKAAEGGGSLAAVAKAAAMKAERAAIEHTLRQVHWNRRKACADPRRQLQDAAQQDQGVRHQPGMIVAWHHACSTGGMVSVAPTSPRR